MSCPIIINLVEGDLLPLLEVEWENSGDVGGYTSFSLKVRRSDGTTYTRAGTVTDDGSTTGNAIFQIAWQSGDLTSGRHSAAFEVVDGASKQETWPGMILDVDKFDKGLPSMQGDLILKKDGGRMFVRLVR